MKCGVILSLKSSLLVAAIPLVSMGIGIGCDKRTTGDSRSTANPMTLVAYCSVDEQFARPILEDYERQHHIQIDALFDSEAGKTTGLVQKIISESKSGRPRADLFWSGEIFHTILLSRMGYLETYSPTTAKDISTRFRDADHRWTGTAVRARVLAYDPKRVTTADLPKSWIELRQERYASQLAIANPLFGTTRGHVASMFALWGSDRARTFLEDLHRHGVRVVDGNSAAVRAVIDGSARYAMTDSDDVRAAQLSGASVESVMLDMGDGGTLLIPCSVSLIKGSPHGGPEARALADYLVSAEVEKALAQSPSGNIPVRESLRNELSLTWPEETKITFDKIVDAMSEAEQATREILLR